MYKFKIKLNNQDLINETCDQNFIILFLIPLVYHGTSDYAIHKIRQGYREINHIDQLREFFVCHSCIDPSLFEIFWKLVRIAKKCDLFSDDKKFQEIFLGMMKKYHNNIFKEDLDYYIRNYKDSQTGERRRQTLKKYISSVMDYYNKFVIVKQYIPIKLLKSMSCLNCFVRSKLLCFD